MNVGSDCYFGRELFLDLQDRILIENKVTVSHRVLILTHVDAGTSPLRDVTLPTSHAPVTIRSGAFIGANATILKGVEIGELAVVGAGAVVTRSVAKASTVITVQRDLTAASRASIAAPQGGPVSQSTEPGSYSNESR